nr:metal transporter Nramp5-like [Ipomoea batatas]
MGSLQQQQAGVVGGGSHRIVAVDASPLPSDSTNKLQLDLQEEHNKKPGWRKFISYVGPGFMVSLAYLDPGNLETDLQAGADHRYELLWVVLIGLVFALIIQSLAANLGVSTGKHLSELCKAEYPKYVKYCLWLLAEIAVIAADIPEVVSVSGTVCSNGKLSKDDLDHCSDLSLNSASFLLKNVLGKSSSTVYAIALLASGQSSTITGTYAGQYIMQGFLDLKMKKWSRNLMTRCIAITPSLIVSIIGGSSGAGRLIIIASIIVVSWILGLGIIGINIYYLSTSFMDWLIHNNLPKAGNVLVGIVVFPLMAIYVVAVIYLMFRKDKVVTFIQPNDDSKLDNANNNNVCMTPIDNGFPHTMP